MRLWVQGHKPKKSNMSNRLNDGSWHHVLVEQILGKKRWRIIVKVDKKWKVKDRTQRNNFNGDLYVGGISSSSDVHRKLVLLLKFCLFFAKFQFSEERTTAV